VTRGRRSSGVSHHRLCLRQETGKLLTIHDGDNTDYAISITKCGCKCRRRTEYNNSLINCKQRVVVGNCKSEDRENACFVYMQGWRACMQLEIGGAVIGSDGPPRLADYTPQTPPWAPRPLLPTISAILSWDCLFPVAGRDISPTAESFTGRSTRYIVVITCRSFLSFSSEPLKPASIGSI
jgi:hypothetical protein